MSEKLLIDTSYTDDITCPYCGEKMEDSWEVLPNEIEFDDEVLECGECGQELIASRQCQFTYSTKKKEVSPR